MWSTATSSPPTCCCGSTAARCTLLTDFGIARLADSPGLTRTQEFVGTPAYVAPESAEGRPQTSAVDIYGAGILLYELVTGHPPFSGGSALEVLHQHLSAEPRRPSTVPDPLWTVIERCLSKNPDRRPSAENLARGLRVVADGVGVHANSAQIAAADNVGALLLPDPAPAAVPDAPGAADPTQVLPHGAGAQGAYDPNAATSFLPHTGPGNPVGAADPTAVLPSRGAADPTAVMPPVPPGRPGQGQYGQQGPQGQQPGGPEEPHPGRTSCARPGTATNRRRSSTSTPTRTRCAAARSGRSPGRSSSSRRSDSSGPRSGRLRTAVTAAGSSRSPSSTPRSSSRSGTRPRRSPSAPRANPGSRGSAAPTR